MPKISIIIPAYNAEKHIERCLDSVLAQKYDDLEIIVINDGSTDKTEEKISKYKEHIIYIKKENAGLSDTRNVGIAKATGTYLMFIDSDDYIEKNLLESLKPYIEQDIDIIKYKAKKINENGNNIELLKGPTFGIENGPEAFSKLCFTDELMEATWLYLYKRELFTKNNFKFAKDLYHEDFGLTPLIILKAKTMVSLDIYGYYYVQSENSITRNGDYEKTVQKFKDLLIHYDNITKTIENYDIDIKTKENVKIFCTNSILLRINELNRNDRKKFIKEIKKRKMIKNIKVRNLKQLIKRILLSINIKLYLKLR